MAHNTTSKKSGPNNASANSTGAPNSNSSASGNPAASAFSSSTSTTARKAQTPMIVERVNRIPMVNFAVSVGFSQYDKLKSSSVTVGDVMTKAEGWAAYVWAKVQPIVEKLQDPINKADQLACNTLDFVEDKLHSMKIPQMPAFDSIVTKCRRSITDSVATANSAPVAASQ